MTSTAPQLPLSQPLSQAQPTPVPEPTAWPEEHARPASRWREWRRLLTGLALRLAGMWLLLAVTGYQLQAWRAGRLLQDPLLQAAAATGVPIAQVTVVVRGELPGVAWEGLQRDHLARQVLTRWPAEPRPGRGKVLAAEELGGAEQWHRLGVGHLRRRLSDGELEVRVVPLAPGSDGRGSAGLALEVRRLWSGEVQDLQAARWRLISALRQTAGVPFARLTERVVLEGWTSQPFTPQRWEAVAQRLVERTGAKTWWSSGQGERFDFVAWVPGVPRQARWERRWVNLEVTARRQGGLWRVAVGSPVVDVPR